MGITRLFRRVLASSVMCVGTWAAAAPAVAQDAGILDREGYLRPPEEIPERWTR